MKSLDGHSDCPGVQWRSGPALGVDSPGHHPLSHEELAPLSGMLTRLWGSHKLLRTIFNC